MLGSGISFSSQAGSPWAYHRSVDRVGGHLTTVKDGWLGIPPFAPFLINAPKDQFPGEKC